MARGRFRMITRPCRRHDRTFYDPHTNLIPPSLSSRDCGGIFISPEGRIGTDMLTECFGGISSWWQCELYVNYLFCFPSLGDFRGRFKTEPDDTHCPSRVHLVQQSFMCISGSTIWYRWYCQWVPFRYSPLGILLASVSHSPRSDDFQFPRRLA
jgi:hypothetical protein